MDANETSLGRVAKIIWKSYETLIELPERAPDALVADKAYEPRRSQAARHLRRHPAEIYNKRLYRQRNTVGLPSKQILPWRCGRRLDTRPEPQRTSTAECTLHGVVFSKNWMQSGAAAAGETASRMSSIVTHQLALRSEAELWREFLRWRSNCISSSATLETTVTVVAAATLRSSTDG
jgi:hypothetical protein